MSSAMTCRRLSISSSCWAITPIASSGVEGSSSASRRSRLSLTVCTASSASVLFSGVCGESGVSSPSVVGGVARPAFRALYASMAAWISSGVKPSERLFLFFAIWFPPLSSGDSPSKFNLAESPALALATSARWLMRIFRWITS